MHHTLDRIARGLGLGGDDRQLLSDKRIDERAFADVGLANEGRVATTVAGGDVVGEQEFGFHGDRVGE